MRHFIFPDGKVVTMAKKVMGLSRYFDQWVHDSDFEVRSSESYHAKLRYDLGPYKIYPERTVIPELKRNGFTGNFHGFTPHKFFSLLLSVPAAETLLKARQIGLLQHLTHYPKDIEKYWRSIRICIRNGYFVKDASTWFDHIKMLEAFEKICSFSYENSTAGEGWRTNTDFLINKKFILPRIVDFDMRWPSGVVKIDYRYGDEVQDIVKALCFLSGTAYSTEYKDTLRGFCNENRVPFGEWIEWGFFRIKGFKKRSMHFEFVDENLWRKFNQRVAEIKGWKNMVTHTTKGRKARK